MNLGKIIYSLGIQGYSTSIKIASNFSEKANFFVEGRKNIFHKMKEATKDDPKPKIWIHAASLGEFEQGRPIIENLKNLYPEIAIVLTFFSPSGYEIRKNYQQADYIFYLPIDSVENAKSFFDIIQPKMAILVKYEFWHYYITESKKRGVPIFSISSIFRENQPFFKGINKSFFQETLKNIDHFFVQNQHSKDLLASIGISNVTVAGDTRFDRVFDITTQRKELPIIKDFKNNQLLWVIGSSWQADIDFISESLSKTTKQLSFKIIIAPHEVDKKTCDYILQKLSFLNPVKYSEASEQTTDFNNHQLLVIDNIGMLTSVYSYADFAWVGGGFKKKGLHNTLEPATFGIPVFFGPYYKKFLEATELIKENGALSFDLTEKLTFTIEKIISEENYLDEMGKNASTYVKSKLGATKIILDQLQRNLNTWKKA